MGEQLDDSGAWSVRLHIKPFVRWIWGGAVLIGLGGLVSASDRRYRQKRKSEQAAASRAASASGQSTAQAHPRSEEHTSELQSRGHLVCRLLRARTKTSQ